MSMLRKLLPICPVFNSDAVVYGAPFRVIVSGRDERMATTEAGKRLALLLKVEQKLKDTLIECEAEIASLRITDFLENAKKNE